MLGAIMSKIAQNGVECTHSVLIFFVSTGVSAIDIPCLVLLGIKPRLMVFLTKSLHLVVEEFSLELMLKQHFGLLFQQTVRQSCSVCREVLVMVLLSKVNDN